MAVESPLSRANLERIKKNISSSYLYFKDNYRRYNDYRNYVFNTSITDAQKTKLNELGKPLLEANILEAYISRLLGEFAKQEPSIEVMPAEGVPIPHQIIEIVEGYIRHVTDEANKNSCSYEVYKDILSGGFSVIKVCTDYASPMSFKQVIKVDRVFDPTLSGFDPMARASHKADGQWSFELFPMTEQDFKRKYPNYETKNISYIRNLEEFNWSYKNDMNESIVLVAEYYEKKKKRTKIVQLANGRVMTERNYKKLGEFWEQEQFIEQIPVIVGKPRWTELETICRYELSECDILSYEETDYSYLPHVFVDGNSILLRQGQSNCTYQMTRPYIYHAKGVQELKNFSMQCLGQYLENMVQHKFIVMKEAIPQEDDYVDALTDLQHQNTIVVNAYSENNPAQPIPTPIREVQNVPAPPEVMDAFKVTDPTTQTILGSYASNLGKNDNDLSGKAVIESASVGNAAAQPYIEGYLAAWTQVGNVIVDLMPKYIKGKREIPIVRMNGEKSYQKVNQKGSPYIDFDENALHVNVRAGVNFQVQKNQALMQITALMGVSQEFNAFMNSPVGLPILVKNLTIYGADELQEAVPQYLQIQQQEKAEAMQMQQQAQAQNPAILRAQAEMQKVQMQGAQNQVENQLEIARIANEKIVADAKLLEAEAKVTSEQISNAVRLEEAETSREVHALDSATKIAEIQSREHDRGLSLHKASIEERKLQHEISNKEKDKELENAEI